MSLQAEQWVRRQVDLHRTPSAVLMDLAARAKHRTLECWPSQQTVAEATGLSRRTVGKAMEYLEQQGFIARERQHRRGTGHRAQDRVTVLMEDVRTVVQIGLTYSEFMAEKHPTLYAHKDSEPSGDDRLCERLTPPMRKPFPARKGRDEWEEDTSTSTHAPSRRDPVHAREASPMRISAQRVETDWALQVEGIDQSYDDNEPFKQVLGDVIAAGLDVGLPVDTLTALLQDSWGVHEHWAIKVAEFEKRVARAAGQHTVLHPGRTA